MKFSLLLFLSTYLLFQTNNINAQQTLTGTVQNAVSQEVLGYVNIGWVNLQLGTVSSESGDFSLAVPKNLRDSAVLRFSMVGYEAQEFLWKDIKSEQNILVELTSVVTDIEEITVVDCPEKKRQQKGNVLKKTPIGFMSFISKELGTEIATRIRLKKKRKSYVKTMTLWIGRHELDTLFFRLNIYDVKEGRPNKNLLTENIFIQILGSGETVTIDLEPYHLVYEQDVFVALEYVRVLESDDEEGVTFGSTFFGKSSYMRFASQSDWAKTPILNLGFSLDVCEQKK